MASEEDVNTIFVNLIPTEQHKLLRERITTAITAARAETWKEAIMFVNIADIGDAKGADATYKIGKMLEAAAGSKTKVFSREDEQKNLGR